MKKYERLRRSLRWLELPLYRCVYRNLRRITKIDQSLLDVGGRKSPYTIGLAAKVTVSDLPREDEVQKALNLGLNQQLIEFIKKNRSNVVDVVFDDMAVSKLADDQFDGLVSVEVIEHVEADGDFVKHAARTLKPGGFFLLTTPNGEWVRNVNPDHKRHYTKSQLETLLSTHFDVLWSRYAVQDHAFRRWGLRSWSPRRPIRTISSMFGNLVGNMMLTFDNGREYKGRNHLVALARKRLPEQEKHI